MEIVIEWLGAAKDILFQWLGWVLAGLLVLTAAVKGTVRFDINEWLKERRKHTKEKLQTLCLHAEFDVRNKDKIEFKSSYILKDSMGVRCQLCGKWEFDETSIVKDLEWWENNPDALLKRFKCIKKLERKLGLS